uniref:NOPS domain-containing protein n=1 Tax=Cebus imitator TaxID=2715852 RepID=A0A2K5RIH2_CEBIM
MSRDRFRSRGGGGGGRGDLQDFRSPPPRMSLNQERGPMGPGQGQSAAKPPSDPPPPQPPPPQQPPPQQPPPQQSPPHPQPHQDSSTPVAARGPGPAPGVGSASPASSSAPPATPPTSGARPGSRPGPTPPPAVTSAHLWDTATHPAGGPGRGPRPKQSPGPGGPKGGKMPDGPKPGGGPGLSTLGGHPKPRQRGGGEPRGGHLHHPPCHRQHHQGPWPSGPGGSSQGKVSDLERFKANSSLLRRPGEKTYTQRCRLLGVYLLISRRMNQKTICKEFGFIKLESRALVKLPNDTPMGGRHQFDPIERAAVDDRGRSTGKGIVEFASKPAAIKAFERCREDVFFLTTTPDGLPEKLAQKNPMYQKERETPPHFAQHGTFEYEYSQRWKSLDEMEKQQREQDAKDRLESEMENTYHEHQANLLHQYLMRRQEKLRRVEELHNKEMQKRKETQLRQEKERQQMRRQREESYSRMGYMDPRERDMRMGGGGTMNMRDPYVSGGQKFPPLGGGGGIGYESNPGVPPATMSGSIMGSDMHSEHIGQGGVEPVSGQGPRGMGPGTPTGYGRGREEAQTKNPDFRRDI